MGSVRSQLTKITADFTEEEAELFLSESEMDDLAPFVKHAQVDAPSEAAARPTS